ncbi:UNKNOWN [Stylonychia lemnae]|uniref:Uncharacterized protein n=1 Tax=Stylonychia lemnae TaxID=5949 RepID=A0A077ZQT1_STYLE|nr:UNKNOWN [Stylonychia lemnae]|eukprot:CDW71745.1 UNKNOWN [Stylonychia lemnae]
MIGTEEGNTDYMFNKIQITRKEFILNAHNDLQLANLETRSRKKLAKQKKEQCKKIHSNLT